MAEIKTIWVSSIKVWGMHFRSEHFVFFLNGWIDCRSEMLFMLFFAHIIAV